MTADVRRRVGLVLILLVALVAAGCGGDDDDAAAGGFVALDGTPRVADAAGVLTEVAEDFSSLTLDGDRRFDVDEELQSFAAGDGSIQPVGRYVGNYVQVGLDGAGDTFQWLGSIASVVSLPDQPARAFFTGVLVDVDEDRLVFRSGTVLEADESLEIPDPPAAVVVTIDVGSRAVTSIEPG